ncbi:hypothetical protein [Paenibacillus silviterrae]|uniref:hypothetical protein n=1 Tax=Paenibacillus silviterrae TaxID=3242194 RepID=UPI0025432911|nr:hypothetical protein [Paenibacillus chinjuensis]
MARGKKNDSEKDAPRRSSRGKAAGKQREDVLQYMDVEASPHLEQMSASWQRVYASVAAVGKG